MVLEQFYKIIHTEEISENKFSYKIELNKDSEIFKGHFPDRPVLPGVCMIQMTKDVVENMFNVNLFMKSTSNVKFMAIINPFIHPIVTMIIEISGDLDTEIKVKNTTSFDETIALKMTNTFVKSE